MTDMPNYDRRPRWARLPILRRLFDRGYSCGVADADAISQKWHEQAMIDARFGSHDVRVRLHEKGSST